MQDINVGSCLSSKTNNNVIVLGESKAEVLEKAVEGHVAKNSESFQQGTIILFSKRFLLWHWFPTDQTRT